MTKIKICGIKNENDISIINEFLPEYAGFVFYEKSKRNISVDTAEKLISVLDERIIPVAVTVSPDSLLVSQLERAGFKRIQIHGDLGSGVFDDINIPIWRAINIGPGNEDALSGITADEKTEGYLLDGAVPGSGRPFNWRKSRRLLKAGVNSPPLFILAGGLDTSNVLSGIEEFSPDVVDVSSSIEGQNGKDKDLVRRFITTVRGKKDE